MVSFTNVRRSRSSSRTLNLLLVAVALLICTECAQEPGFLREPYRSDTCRTRQVDARFPHILKPRNFQTTSGDCLGLSAVLIGKVRNPLHSRKLKIAKDQNSSSEFRMHRKHLDLQLLPERHESAIKTRLHLWNLLPANQHHVRASLICHGKIRDMRSEGPCFSASCSMWEYRGFQQGVFNIGRCSSTRHVLAPYPGCAGNRLLEGFPCVQPRNNPQF